MSTIVHIPVKLPPVELGARQCKLPHVRVAASDKSINLLIILICPWHESTPQATPTRVLIELTTEYSARLLQGDPLERPQRAKELGTKEICCWFVSNMGTTIKNPQTTGSLHQNGNILNHLDTDTSCDWFWKPKYLLVHRTEFLLDP